MKSKIMFLVVAMLLAGLMLAACSPSGTPASTPAATEAGYPAPAPAEPAAYPAPAEPAAYPAPGQPVQAFSVYPGPSEGVTNYIDWSKAEELILGGQVSEAYHDMSQHVTLVLKDGSVALTLEPVPDDLSRAIEKCGDACKDIEQVSQ